MIASLPPAPAPSNTGGINPHQRKDQREGKRRKEIGGLAVYSDLIRVMSVADTPPAEGGACSFAVSHIGGAAGLTLITEIHRRVQLYTVAGLCCSKICYFVVISTCTCFC
jgi:hypothetical protein